MEVQDVAEEVFGSRASQWLPDLDLSDAAGFSFKLNDVGHMLDYVVSFGRRALPGALGRRAVLREAEDQLLHMFDRHAGRLRSALVEQVRQGVTGYQRELADSVEQAVAEIEASVERAAAELRKGEAGVCRRRSELDGLRRRLASLADELSELGEQGNSSAQVEQPARKRVAENGA